MYRLRREGHIFRLRKATIEGDIIFGKQPTHEFDAFNKPRRAFTTISTKGVELIMGIAHPDPHIEAAIRNNIGERDILGRAHWVNEWQEQHEGADPNSARYGRYGSSHRQGRGVVGVLCKMMRTSISTCSFWTVSTSMARMDRACDFAG